MLKIVTSIEGQISIDKIDEKKHTVFAKRHGELVGMVVKEEAGWIVRIGGLADVGSKYNTILVSQGAYGHWKSLIQCIEKGADYAYTFYIDDN